jgi:hypothetical protein
MNERNEVLKYLKSLIPDKVSKKIKEKTGGKDFYLKESYTTYKKYKDFNGTIKFFIMKEGGGVIGHMTFVIIQKSFTLSELDKLIDAPFNEFVKKAKMIYYEI